MARYIPIYRCRLCDELDSVGAGGFPKDTVLATFVAVVGVTKIARPELLEGSLKTTTSHVCPAYGNVVGITDFVGYRIEEENEDD